MLPRPMTDDHAEINMPRRHGMWRNARSGKEGKRVARSNEGGARGERGHGGVDVGGRRHRVARRVGFSYTNEEMEETNAAGLSVYWPTKRAARRWSTT